MVTIPDDYPTPPQPKDDLNNASKESKKSKDKLARKALTTLSDPFKNNSLNTDHEWKIALEKIKERAKTDLFLDNQSVISEFSLQNFFNAVPLEKQKIYQSQLEITLNEAYVKRILKDKGRLTTGTETESEVLNLMGPAAKNLSKEKIYEKTKLSLETKLKHGQFQGTLQETKQWIADVRLRVRLELLGMKGAHVLSNFRLLEKSYQVLDQKGQKWMFPIAFPLSFFSPLHDLPRTFRTIEHLWSLAKAEEMKNTLNELFMDQEIVNALINSPSKAFESLLKEKEKINELTLEVSILDIIDSAQRSHTFQKKLAFYEKWGSYLKVERAQEMSDLDMVLGEGICLGQCHKIRFAVQKDKNIKPNELSTYIKIDKRDRFLFAQFTSAYRENATTEEKLAQNNGYLGVRYLSIHDYDHFSLTDSTVDVNLKPSNGWLMNLLQFSEDEDGHATLMRIDPKANAFWFFDPNHGLFCFEETPPNISNSKTLLNAFFEDLIASSYTGLKHILHQQLINP